VLESQPQRTVGMIASPLATAGIDTALLVVRQLLNNPPPSRASPSAAKQWRHDVRGGASHLRSSRAFRQW
jgi:hypothetical protein